MGIDYLGEFNLSNNIIIIYVSIDRCRGRKV